MTGRLTADGAILLAGGSSSRMGEPKALFEVEGVPMLRRVLGVLQKSGIPEVVLCVRDNEQGWGILGQLHIEQDDDGIFFMESDGIPITMCPDIDIGDGGCSPAIGLMGGVLHAIDRGWQTVQVVPCDVPFLDSRLPSLLHSKLTTQLECVVPRSNHGLEPLLLCARSDALKRATDDSQDSIHNIVAKMKSNEVGPSDWAVAGITDRCFTNVNSKDDLVRL